MTAAGPDIAEIRALAERIRDQIIDTPVMRCAGIEAAIGGSAKVFA